MTVFSRFLEAAGFTTVYTPCHQLTHPWNESCIGAMADVVPRSLIYSLKTYLTFYTLAYGLRWARGRKIKIDQLIKDTLRSMAFLTSNMCLFLYVSCLLRQFFGCYFWSSFYIAGVIGAYLSIIQESKKRRPVLALYLTNLASESLFYQLRNRGYVSNIPHGVPLLFVIGLGLLFYFKAYGIKSDMHGILSFTHSLENDEKIKILNRLPDGIQNVIRRIREKYSKSRECHHQHSCVSNILESSLANFNKGLAVSVVLTALRSLSSPRNFFKNLLSTKTLAIPTFSALLPGIYHTVNCGLNRYSRLSPKSIMTIAGASSGAAMLAWPNLTIAMYILWKAIENIYDHLADKGYLPRFKNGDVLLYSIVTGYIVGNCVVEPHALRPGYYFGFIRGLTLNHIDYLNRQHLRPFGFDSDRIYRQSNEVVKIMAKPK
ncbi:unnamed protein product [Bursaphelenchus xylophilus]|uniref:(pine wood nematode) hypothetical protein n=1 Tax=Bursaphelenchus xylophilus TaxID=6326 RepID=A0A1I7SRZ8_BURXY|nr:unnamed protein product [Bursaphelenchus xylophilus]CAG9105872.1 unnamed protein product [Bursaphelenchus xylophilus]